MEVINKISSEDGSVTVEATISLSAFMFTIVTILTIVNICLAQARMSYALNTTAKEISQYSYLYSLTGFNQSQSDLYESGKQDTQELNQLLSDINTVYNEIENLGNSGKQTPNNVEDIVSSWDNIVGSAEKIEGAGNSIYKSLSDIASDPKEVMFGIAKLLGSEGLDLAKSKLIAAPLAKVMIQKHLVNSKDGDVEEYLQFLGVVPSGTGTYLDGLDFSESTLFPNGSNEIRINVQYDIKVIPLLPIDFTFHFNQTAVTHGWLAGEESYQNSYLSGENIEENGMLWTTATINERSFLIRHMVIDELCDEGYAETSGLSDVHLYDAKANEFVLISSMNPLWSEDGESIKSVDDIDEKTVQRSIELLCGKIESTTSGLNNVTIKKENKDHSVIKKEYACSGAKNKIVLVIPEDRGLKEKIQSIVEQSNTRGVEIEIVSGYGNAASSTVNKKGDSGS